jgi:hypothetical protein
MVFLSNCLCRIKLKIKGTFNSRFILAVFILVPAFKNYTSLGGIYSSILCDQLAGFFPSENKDFGDPQLKV